MNFSHLQDGFLSHQRKDQGTMLVGAVSCVEIFSTDAGSFWAWSLMTKSKERSAEQVSG